MRLPTPPDHDAVRGERATDAGRRPAPDTPVPRPYGTPRITIYGRLDELTRFGGSQMLDSGGGLGNMP